MGSASQDSENYRLTWNDFDSHIKDTYRLYRRNITNNNSLLQLVDVQLVVPKRQTSNLAGQYKNKNRRRQQELVYIGAHKLILTSCSPFFNNLLLNKSSSNKSPDTIYLHGIDHEQLEQLLDFVYEGEVSVQSADLDKFLEIANSLQIKGLTESCPSEEEPEDSKAGIKKELEDDNFNEENQIKKEVKVSNNSRQTIPFQQTEQFVDDEEIQDVTPSEINMSQILEESSQMEYSENVQDYRYCDSFVVKDEVGDLEENVMSNAALGGDPSLMSEEAVALSQDINQYLHTLTIKEFRSYKCLKCLHVSANFGNHRLHVTGKHMDESVLIKKLDEYVKKNIFQQSGASFTCIICRKGIKQSYSVVRSHFLAKHLNFSPMPKFRQPAAIPPIE